MNSIEKLIAKWRIRGKLTVDPGFRVIYTSHADDLEQAARESAAPLSPENEVALKALHAAAGKGPSAIPAAPVDEFPGCNRCQQDNIVTVRVLTGFSGEFEYLCGDCVSKEYAQLWHEIESASSSERDAPAERWTCPDCGYDSMPYPPKDYHICPKCMVEFGNDDRKTKLLSDRDAVRREAFQEACDSIQKAIDVWKTWETDDGYQAIQTALGIMDRIRALAASPAGRAEQEPK